MIRSGRLSHGMAVALAILFLLFLASRHLRSVSPSYQFGYKSETHSIYSYKKGQQTNTEDIVNASTTTTIQHVEVPQPPEKDPSCAWLPDMSNILLIMKTGASEAYEKVPTQLVTTLRCHDDFLIFSDMKQSIAGVDIHDSLETMLPEAMEGNPDFDLYRRQKACAVDQEKCNKEAEGSSSSEGWSLDKYKNIHIAERVYDMRPDYDWYITVDADTYVLWPNLVQLLSTLDPSQKHYIGSVTMIGDFPFGHGGSGYILSQAAMKAFVEENPGVASKYDVQTQKTCCGDYMFAKALNDTTGIKVQNVWPTINGEKPFTLPFGPSEWCQPIATMHHMNSEEISTFWEFEKRFYESQEPTSNHTLLLKDIYEEFSRPRLEAKREDWDNLSEDVYYLNAKANKYETWQLDRAKQGDLSDTEEDAHMSFEHCAKMCDEVEECFQFRFQDGICSYQKGFLLGHPKKKDPKEDERWISGWPVEKIKAWVQEHRHCDKPLWPTFD